MWSAPRTSDRILLVIAKPGGGKFFDELDHGLAQFAPDWQLVFWNVHISPLKALSKMAGSKASFEAADSACRRFVRFIGTVHGRDPFA